MLERLGRVDQAVACLGQQVRVRAPRTAQGISQSADVGVDRTYGIACACAQPSCSPVSGPGMAKHSVDSPNHRRDASQRQRGSFSEVDPCDAVRKWRIDDNPGNRVSQAPVSTHPERHN